MVGRLHQHDVQMLTQSARDSRVKGSRVVMVCPWPLFFPSNSASDSSAAV